MKRQFISAFFALPLVVLGYASVKSAPGSDDADALSYSRKAIFLSERGDTLSSLTQCPKAHRLQVKLASGFVDAEFAMVDRLQGLAIIQPITGAASPAQVLGWEGRRDQHESGIADVYHTFTLDDGLKIFLSVAGEIVAVQTVDERGRPRNVAARQLRTRLAFPFKPGERAVKLETSKELTRIANIATTEVRCALALIQEPRLAQRPQPRQPDIPTATALAELMQRLDIAARTASAKIYNKHWVEGEATHGIFRGLSWDQCKQSAEERGFPFVTEFTPTNGDGSKSICGFFKHAKPLREAAGVNGDDAKTVFVAIAAAGGLRRAALTD